MERPRTRAQVLLHHMAAAADSTPPAAARGPLHGVKVLDMSTVISGPWGASILADQGADVVKVEGPLSPDFTRSLGPAPPNAPGQSAMYMSANRGKRSISIDIQKPEGVGLIQSLVKVFDVVIQVPPISI